MAQGISDAILKHRIALSAALMVGGVLVVFIHAPIIPVLAGCIIAVLLAVLKTRSSDKNSHGFRGGQ